MYQYQSFDHEYVAKRVADFRLQVKRRLAGELSEEEFRPLRLMNGLYLQLHAYMLRVAIPYGSLNSRQMNQLAFIADKYDKGYGHFTTRQNIQYNWPKLEEVPDILEALSQVEMHAIQTSGNCIRNVTADHFAGAAADEIEDPRPTAELLRQWSTDHPEFIYLPRKFKIAITGSPHDRAVTKAHDIGLRMLVNEWGEKGYEVIVGGGLGRTPMIGKIIKEFLPKADLLPYLEAILAYYNEEGRRDNKYKARIKITLHENGIEAMRDAVEDKFIRLRQNFKGIDQKILKDIEQSFLRPEFLSLPLQEFQENYQTHALFRSWVDTNLAPHVNPEYAIVSISLKAHGKPPGDATSKQMRTLAHIAKTYAHDDIRVSHEQNIILPHVHKAYLFAIYQLLREVDLHIANIGLISDLICCPGLDYCDLATARSIPIAQEIALKFMEKQNEAEIGPLKIKMSGCINACGHHHLGNIGILGLDRAGVENYQITLGGDASENLALGDHLGQGFDKDHIVPAIETIIDVYLENRQDEEESFLQYYRRKGVEPFRQALYPSKTHAEGAGLNE